MNTKTKVPIGAGFFSGLLVVIGTVVGAEYDHKIEKEFQVSTEGKLIVQADRGSIEVSSDARDKVHVRVFRHVKGGSQAQADELFGNHDVTFRQDGNNVSLIGRNKKDRFRFGSIRQPSLQVRYEISIPKRFDVDLNTSGGDILIANAGGDLVARTSSGSIKVQRARGKVEASNSGGDIQVDEADKDVVASTSSGSITFKTVQGGVQAKNSGGDITIESA